MATEEQNQKTIAFVLYPGLTLFDLAGPLQVFTGVSQLAPEYRTVVVGESAEPIDNDLHVKMIPTHTFEEVPYPSILLVPGDRASTFRAMSDEAIRSYVRSAAETADVAGSICTGALILASVGLLEGRQATTHWAYYKILEELGAKYVRKRWVEDGKFISSAGVSAGIDMALHLAARLTDEETARRVQRSLGYDPHPPFGGHRLRSPRRHTQRHASWGEPGGAGDSGSIEAAHQAGPVKYRGRNTRARLFESRRKELLVEMSSAAYAPLSPTVVDNFKNPLRLPGESGVMGVLDASDVPARISAQKESVEILPGKSTELRAYRAERDGKTYLNPTIKVRTGANFHAEFANDLDEETTVHWHGLHVDWQMDGHPFRPVAPGATYDYAFPVHNRAGTYWYHPHPHGGTARQIYSGLAGFFLVDDEDEQRLVEALDLQLGKTDIPLLIQDKVLDEDGNFVYEPDTMAVDMGYEGDVVLVNLTPTPYLEVGTRIYRFRMLNGSNARTYRIAFTKVGEDELLPYHVIGTDGGLLERPRVASEVFLSSAERMDLLLDLSSFEVGEELVLKSLPFDPMHHEHEMEPGGGTEHAGHMERMDHTEHMGHMGHMEHTGHTEHMGHMKQMEMEQHHQTGHQMDHHMGPARLPDGGEFYLLKVVVGEKTDYSSSVPETLSEIPQPEPGEADARPITISMTTDEGGMRWLINGKTHTMDEFPIVLQRGAKEVWEIYNHERSMPHPIHLHGFQFRVLERVGTPEQVAHLAVDEKGRLVSDLGLKDTVLLWPGETVKCAMDFSHGFEGEQFYMFHCHILEHEMGMMLNLKVVDSLG